MADHPLSADLEQILDRTRPIWEELRGCRLFVTGGTGFTGCWLLESFAWANERLNLRAKMVVLTRDDKRFRQKAAHLAYQENVFEFYLGDLKDFKFPAGSFSHIIHAGTVWPTGSSDKELKDMQEGIVDGTRHALEFATECRAKKFLFVGSGAVYGPQPPDMTHIPEDYIGARSDSVKRTPYGEGKKISEELCEQNYKPGGIEITMDRGFAFVGPYLPLDLNFAIGNFIRDALAGGPIKVNGDGTPLRSYLYAADLAAWLWTILLRGQSNRAYNVGSSQAISIAETARTVARVLGETKPIEVKIDKIPVPGQPAMRYVPNVTRAFNELQLEPWTPLDDAIRATASWEKWRRRELARDRS